MKTSFGVKYAPRIKASNIVAGRAYQMRPDTPVFKVLSITSKYRREPERSSLTLHRLALCLVDGELKAIQVGFNQTYLEVKE